MIELTIIMPVYNEEEVIAKVLNDWLIELRKLSIDFELHVYNDGSNDSTKDKINEVSESNSELILFDKENSGHGPTIIEGYKKAQSEWIFQTDSDNEIRPNQFKKLWESREYFDFIIGQRINRDSPLSRKIIT